MAAMLVTVICGSLSDFKIGFVPSDGPDVLGTGRTDAVC